MISSSSLSARRLRAYSRAYSEELSEINERNVDREDRGLGSLLPSSWRGRARRRELNALARAKGASWLSLFCAGAVSTRRKWSQG